MRIAAAALIALAGCTSSGPRWSSQASTTDEPLRAVWGSSAGDVYAVGGDGTVLHSGDRGASWKKQTTNSISLLFGVSGSGASDVYAVGTLGTALHTSDGGATWTTYKTGTYLPIHAIHAAAPGRLVAAAGDDLAGSQVLAAAPSDQWAVQAALGEISVPRPQQVEPVELMGIWGAGDDLVAVGENELVGGGSIVLRSSDGGKSWTKKLDDVGEHLTAVWGSAANDLYAVGFRGTIVHSSDGGASWSPLQSGTDATLYAVWGSGADDVYVVGDLGTILHSGDRGHTWEAQPSGTTKWLTGVWGSGPSDVYVVGEDGTILHRG